MEEFVKGCYAGLRMALPLMERKRGLAAEGLPEEGAGRSAEEEGLVTASMREAISRDKAKWLVESEVEGEDDPDQERPFQEVDRRGEDQPLEIAIPEDERSDGWHTPSDQGPDQDEGTARQRAPTVHQRLGPRRIGCCARCGKDGHWARDCEEPGHPQGPPCFRCNRRGHLQKNCPEPEVRRGQFERRDARRQRRDEDDERRAGIGRGRSRDAIARDYVLKVAAGRARISGRLLPDRRP